MTPEALILAAADAVGTTNGKGGVFQPLQDWWRTSIDQEFGVWSFFWIGVIASLIGFLVWVVIFARVWRRGKFWKLLPSIIAHVHHRKIHAFHHIIAALFAFSGLSLAGGFLWAKLFNSDPSAVGYMMTNAGMVLGVLTLILTIWTLNQTMKLERLHGEGIERFDELIKEITKQMIDLVNRYDENRDKSSGIYRVILVTNNPYFGIISYRGRPVEQNFETAFHSLAGRIEAERKASPTTPSGFRLKIICADKARLKEFVASYSSGESDKAGLEDATEKSEEFIASLIKKTGADSVVRIPIRVSEAQFAVVGDFVFEFFLDPQDGKNTLWKKRGSNIRATNVIHDRGAADRFERFAQFLEELIKNHDALIPEVATEPPEHR